MTTTIHFKKMCLYCGRVTHHEECVNEMNIHDQRCLRCGKITDMTNCPVRNDSPAPWEGLFIICTAHIESRTVKVDRVQVKPTFTRLILACGHEIELTDGMAPPKATP